MCLTQSESWKMACGTFIPNTCKNNVCVLLCWIEPIFGNRYGPWVCSRRAKGAHIHDWESPTYLLALSWDPVREPSGGQILTLGKYQKNVLPGLARCKCPRESMSKKFLWISEANSLDTDIFCKGSKKLALQGRYEGDPLPVRMWAVGMAW